MKAVAVDSFEVAESKEVEGQSRTQLGTKDHLAVLTWRCGACGLDKVEADFSANQLHKGKGYARCLACVRGKQWGTLAHGANRVIGGPNSLTVAGQGERKSGRERKRKEPWTHPDELEVGSASVIPHYSALSMVPAALLPYTCARHVISLVLVVRSHGSRRAPQWKRPTQARGPRQQLRKRARNRRRTCHQCQPSPRHRT
jgi:hypothetical protein